MRFLPCFALCLALAPLVVSAAEGPDFNSPAAVVQGYVDACYTGDAKKLESLFHEKALMTGHSKNGFYLGSPEPFFERIRTSKSLKAQNAPYVARITQVQVSGSIASVTLEETGYFGRGYTDIFSLARLDGEWKILTKTYYQTE